MKTITQIEYRNRMGELIRKDCDKTLYGMDIVYPLLEKMEYEKVISLLREEDSLIDVMQTLSDNINLALKDRLTKHDKNTVYILNDYNLPMKMTKEDYTILIKDYIIK